MSAFSILAPCGAGEVGLFGLDGYDLQMGTNHEQIELAARRFALSGLKDDSSFEHARSGYQPTSCCSDGRERNFWRSGALKQMAANAEVSMTINLYQLGIPCSS